MARRLKREKKDLEENPIKQGNYDEENLSVDIMVESRYIVIMYMFNDDIIYRLDIPIPQVVSFWCTYSALYGN